jgi:GntR family transcriptional regulator
MNYIKIDKTIKKALYLQIRDSIEDAIRVGVLADNDRLPTESELCEVFNMSDIVVKNAYKLLVKQGLVTRVQGSGTYVSTRKMFKFPLKGFDKIGDFGAYAYTSKEKRVVLFDISKDLESISLLLNLREGERYYVAKYVVLVDQAEVLYQTLYLPEKLFPKLAISDLEQSNLPQLLTVKYPYHMKRVKNGFSPVNMTSSEAQLLNTFKHAAAHRVRTTIFGDQDVVIAYLETLFLGQYTQFEVIVG